MAIKWTDQQRQIGEVVLRHRRQEGSGYDLNAVQEELPSISTGRISEVVKALRENGWVIPVKEEKTPLGKRPLADFKTRKTAPVLFDIGEETIELSPSDLYDSYQLYRDLTAKGIIEEDRFSAVLKDGMGLIWRVLATRPAFEPEKVTISEVSHGRSTGESDTGAGLERE